MSTESFPFEDVERTRVESSSVTHSEMPLRVMLASTERGWHGGEEQCRLLANELRARGHECRIVALEQGAFSQRLKAEGFHVYTFPQKGWSPVSIYKIRQAVREFKPDVLHYNDAHSMSTMGLGSVFYPIPVRVCSRRVDFPINTNWHYNNLVDRVICISTVIADVCRRGGIHHDHLEVAHSGVDPNRMSSGNRERGRESLACSDDENVILSVATLTDHKGHRYLLEAIPGILERFPKTILALAGDGHLTEALKSQADELKISDHVRFLGFRDDIPDLMAACDLFVISSHLEGLCTSIIDAMLAKRPIVATRAGGIPDLMGETFAFEEEPVSWMAEPKCPDALTATITAALGASSEEREQRIENAFARALKYFTNDRMVEKNLQIYQSILSKKSVKAA